MTVCIVSINRPTKSLEEFIAIMRGLKQIIEGVNNFVMFEHNPFWYIGKNHHKKDDSLWDRLVRTTFSVNFRCKLRKKYDQYDLMRVLKVHIETNIHVSIAGGEEGPCIKRNFKNWNIDETIYDGAMIAGMTHNFESFDDYDDNINKLAEVLSNKDWKMTASCIELKGISEDLAAYKEMCKQCCPNLVKISTV